MTDSAWNEFIKYPPTTPKEHPVAKCIHCNHKLSGQAQRLRVHLDSCQKYSSFLNSNQNEFNLLSGTITQKDPNLPLDPFLLRQLNPIEKQTIDKKIACTFYANGIPHALIENDFVIAALKSLHPTYNPPSRCKITNYFNSHQVVKAYLHETQKQEMNKTVALVNPVKTRWGTQLALLEKLLESKS
ncbi:24397_t:CDS:2, partial [Cetraspora pellucida]